jgi:hypothetical protein
LKASIRFDDYDKIRIVSHLLRKSLNTVGDGLGVVVVLLIANLLIQVRRAHSLLGLSVVHGCTTLSRSDSRRGPANSTIYHSIPSTSIVVWSDMR